MGLITVEKTDNPDEQILKIIDLGVEDVEEATDALEVYIRSQNLGDVREKLGQSGFKVLNAELVRQAKNEIQIKDSKKATKVLKLMNSLQEHDDIQRVFANFDIPEEILQQIHET